MTERYKGSAKSGGIKSWFFHRWTGVILVIMLITHFFISHFNGHEHVTYEMVMERLTTPAWKTFDLAFLYFASYHGIYGAYNVISDYKLNKTAKVAVFSIGIALISYLVIFGTITIVSLKSVGG